jgi:uncharacterized membrane-anchored protein
MPEQVHSKHSATQKNENPVVKYPLHDDFLFLIVILPLLSAITVFAQLHM